ncbi:MAG: AsmA-like C-terminal domain-containing protein, partial [Desulfobacteraceae bacterium]
MTKRKKIFRIVIISVGALLAILLAFQIIVPKLINLESIKGKILATASEKVGGEVKCHKIGLSFFPYPHVVINQVSLSIPGKVSGSLDTLGVYLQFLPLLRGKIQLEEVTLKSPEFKVALPKKATKKPEKELPETSLDIPALSSQILVPLILEVPNLEVEIENGKLDLSQEDESLFSFKDITASVVLPPEGFKIQISSTSNLWNKMGVKSTLNATDYKGKAHIELNNFQPHRLISQLSEDSPLKLADSSMNMSVDLNVNGLNNLQAEIQGSIPFLSFQNGNKKVAIKGKSLKSLFSLDENEIAFSLAELNLEYPKVNLSGGFLSGRHTQSVKMELEGRDVDVPTVREVALALAGDVPDVQEIFGIVRGGKVPLITLKSEGSTYDQLGDMKNILIKGHIVEGKIMVPDVELDLEDARGNVVISKGILEGENLEARLGNSWGRDGKLKLGLADDDSFHLDMGVQADLRELPPIMKRLLDDKSLQKEMSLIEDLKGNAVGKLVLGETTEAVKVRVDVSKLNLSAKYQKIPFPIVISGGQFSFDETRIAVKDLTGKMGKSSFAQLSASVSLNQDPYLEVKSGIFDFFLEEIYSWLVSMEGSPMRAENIKTVKGGVHIGRLSLKGPLLKPEKWQLKTSWETRNAVLDSSLLPAPVKISQGKFEGRADFKNQKLSFKNVQVGMLDAAMTISGALNDYYKGLNNINLSLDGVVGPESNRWLASLLQTPPQLVLQAPFSISKGQLRWKQDAETSFKADLVVPGGASISTDILYSPEEIKAKEFIKDDVSQASLAFRLKGRELDLQFNGNLKKETLNNLFVQSGFFHGWLEGDFQAYISLDHPMKSTAQGHLMGEDLIFPRELEIPLEIDKISLKAKERHVDLEQATLVSGSQQMDLKGSLDFSPPGLIFDMDLQSNGISWTDIEGLLGEGDKENELEQGKESWDLPIQGTVKLKSEYLNYERFTWFPFHADITFAQNEIDVKVIQAKLCHIATPGSVKITPQDVSLDFDFASRDQELNPSLLCISGQSSDYTGRFDLLGKIKARGKGDKLLEALNGDLEFTARDGRIRRSVPLQRAFAYLNVTKSLRGQLPDMTRDEFIYNSITAKATFQNGKAIFNEAIIDSPSMEIITQGYVDYIKNEIDLLILVAPFKTLDWVVKKIPLVRRVLQGTLIAVPVRVSGDLADPKVSPMSASAVGSSLLDVMKRTVELPFELMEVEPT